jgi:hypothetical protein
MTSDIPWMVNPFKAQVDEMDKLDDDSNPVPVCKLLWPTKYRTEKETEDIGALIASAPTLAADLTAERARSAKLVEAIEYTMDQWASGYIDGPTHNAKIRELIAEHRGEVKP